MGDSTMPESALKNVTHILPRHLKQLEAESIEIMREVVAEFKKTGHAVFDRQGFQRHAASGDQGILPRKTSLPAFAHRHDVEVSRNDRLS
jgi:hypothetical protein